MVGERLSELRKDKGLTQKEFAKILGISENSVSMYERNLNTPDDQMKIKIAEYFNVSLDYLLGVIEEPLPLRRTNTIFLFAKNMPSNAEDEMRNFLNYLQNKYKLN